MDDTSFPQNAAANDLANNKNIKDFLVVGIGASAGGVQALKEFFENVQPNSGIAYVVILHLSPDHDSQLANILQTVSIIPVQKVTEKIEIKKDNVYVVPPNRSLHMFYGGIAVEDIHTSEERRAPVDIFFRSLAESHESHAVAVILSGTGANGSMGLKRIKEKGGVVFVQNPREAEYNDMPRNAIATELVDEILNVRAIPAKILAYKESIGKIEIPDVQEDLAEIQQAALREVFTQLHIRTGHDFTNYKRETVLRRIERRINVRQLNSLPSYAAFLRNTPEESQALLKDLLISVTNFFRDRTSFEYLETNIFPRILLHKKTEDTIRIWIAGCATGEEAYSLAMLLYEKMQEGKEMPIVQIFATDIDEAAIATARDGFYTLNDAADVSPERLRRFFIPEANGFRIRKELREMVLFAIHNVIKDPPFSRVDMITCRNLLIYLNQGAQNRVMETFHFALNPGGFLFLGSSESVDGATDLYVAESKEHQVFQSRQATTRPIPVPDNNLPVSFRVKLPENENRETKNSREQENRTLERISLNDLHQRLLEQYAPPSIVVNETHDVVHISEKAGRFLQVTGGEPSVNILRLIKQELRLELRTALYQAVQKGINIEIKNLSVTTNGHSEKINVHVRPVLRQNDTARGFVLLIFEPSEDKFVTDRVEVFPAESEPITLQLEEEITYLKSQLRTSNEQFEIQTEELKASNEELQAMNEELRSAAEELETSKEELQSINEELITVNQELKIKIEEVSHSNNDFLNLINSTDIGTVFLDRNFRVKLFTPAACEIFNLIQADIGRPLSDITSQLEYDKLIADVEIVLQKLQPVEREVTIKGERTFLMQLLPYRTAEDRISGVVIVFVNITQRKRAEEALRGSNERMRLLAESATDFAILTLDINGIINSWNSGAEKVFGWPEKEIIGQPGDVLFTPEDRTDGAPEGEMKKTLETGRSEDERWHIRKDGSRFYASGVMSLLKDGKGFAKIARDMTDKLKSEKALKDNEEHYRIALEAGELATWDWNTITNKIVWNDQHYRLFGINHKEDSIEPEFFLEFICPEDLAYVKNQLAEVMGETGIYSAEFRIIRENDQAMRWMNGYGRVTERVNGKPTRISGVMFDCTERREAADKLEATQNTLYTALEAAKMGVWNMNLKTKYIDRSGRHDQLLGFTTWQEEWDLEKAKQYIIEEDKAKFDEAYEKLYTDGTFQLEVRVKHQANNICWIHYYGRVFKNENEEMENAAGVIFDITDRKTIEKQKDDFIGIASHELKTPVTSIKAYAEILQELFTNANDMRSANLMGKLDKQVDRLTNLIKDLLDVTKISEGQLELNKETINFTELIRNVTEEMQRTTRNHKINVTASTLPMITGDKERLGQVLTNLLSNAIKYSPNAADISVNTFIKNNEIHISVQDFGIGMTAGTQARLFERFYRSEDATTRSFPGLGLGLYISLQIMKRHGGRIEVKSEKEKGSVFTMILPVN